MNTQYHGNPIQSNKHQIGFKGMIIIPDGERFMEEAEINPININSKHVYLELNTPYYEEPIILSYRKDNSIDTFFGSSDESIRKEKALIMFLKENLHYEQGKDFMHKSGMTNIEHADYLAAIR